MDLLDLDLTSTPNPKNPNPNLDSIFDSVKENTRFSIVILEKDVTDYMRYRSKYYFYNNKIKSSWLIRRSKYKKLERFYYNLYINKMKYLEETYRRTNNYTKYHSQLENLPQANIIDNTNANGGLIYG
jgi:hypothetical protein